MLLLWPCALVLTVTHKVISHWSPADSLVVSYGQAANPRSNSEQTSPSGRKAEIRMQMLSSADPAGSDSEASDTEAHALSSSDHQQKVCKLPGAVHCADMATKFEAKMHENLNGASMLPSADVCTPALMCTTTCNAAFLFST